MSSTIVTVVVGCMAAGVVTIITLPKFLKRIKQKSNANSAHVAELKQAKWTKVGTVRHLYLYPIMCGKEFEVPYCTFQDDGLTIVNDNGGLLRDKMFVIYDEETRCVQTCRNYTIMVKLKVQAINKDTVSFREGDDSLLVDLRHKTLKNNEIVECKVWNNSNETLYYIECIDCGKEAAAWMSNTLMGKCSGLRLGYYVNRTLKVLTLWDSFGGLRDIKQSLRKTVECDKDKNKQLPSYTMITQQSLNEVNKSLLKDKMACDFGASFIITVPKAFSECQYEYVKIGDDVIISNLKPWTRPRINPLSIPNDLKLKLMSVNCKVLSSGQVKVNDEVYIRADE